MHRALIRIFDLLLSLIGLLFLLPFFILISLFIMFNSRGPAFFLQKRVGMGNIDFLLWKFRTMYAGSEAKDQITVGEDSRITGVGRFLRKYKLDELPQLVNVLIGDMSFVGPRPEVRKYVDLYTDEQRKVLLVKPGITDFASIEYSNESEILARSEDPLKTYVEKVMPEKILLNMKFIQNHTVGNYFNIIFRTIGKVLRGK